MIVCSSLSLRISVKRSLLWEGDQEVPRGCSSFGRAPDTFDIVGNLRLLPQFNEKDPDTLFSLFERVADARS